MKLKATMMKTLECECGGVMALSYQVDTGFPGMYLHQCVSCKSVALLSGQKFPDVKQWDIETPNDQSK